MVFALDRMWRCEGSEAGDPGCGAFGYYDDGEGVYPAATYRVHGRPGAFRFGELVRLAPFHLEVYS